MRTIILRGEVCKVDSCSKTIQINIRKPKDQVFSLSDKFLSFVKKGYTGIAHLPSQDVEITKETRSFKTEEVPTRFANSKNWFRHWFIIPAVVSKEQYEFTFALDRDI